MLLSSLLMTAFALLCRSEMKIPASISVTDFGCPQAFATFGCCPYFYICLDDIPYVESCDEGLFADVETHDCMQRKHVAACSPNSTADANTDLRGLTCHLLKQMNKTQEDERRKVINDVSPIPGRPYEVNCTTSEGYFSIGCTRFYYLCINYTPLILRCGHGRTYNTDREECGPRRDIEECEDIAEGTGEVGLARTELEEVDDDDELFGHSREEEVYAMCDAPEEFSGFCGDKPDGYYPLAPCGASFLLCEQEWNSTTLYTCLNGTKYDDNVKFCAMHDTVDGCMNIKEDADEGSAMPKCPEDFP